MKLQALQALQALLIVIHQRQPTSCLLLGGLRVQMLTSLLLRIRSLGPPSSKQLLEQCPYAVSILQPMECRTKYFKPATLAA